ncbi:MAG: tRNA (guanine(10)-N(2))-dimethyltransferase [Candidatus Methanomethylicaceae archaeon]|nr:tRNA (guanine(10)-N(2))-dimethyltransferase [Candidatus Verstraetearchaeota archaeon]
MRLIEIREGKTSLRVPDFAEYARKGAYDPSRAPVFYNPKMEFSRDLAVLALKSYINKINHNVTVCDPLAGVGVRGIRYAKEVDGVEKSVVGDLNKDAIPIILENVKINGLEEKVEVEHKDANLLLTTHSEPGKRFDFVDLDPFGTPIPFLDSAIRAIKNKGVVALTATDTAPLCGVYVKPCLRKYGAFPLRGEICHEVGLRILIGSAVFASIREDFGVVVLLSYSVDHYFRAYLQLDLGAKKADSSASLLGYLLYCPNCSWRDTVPLSGAVITSCPSCQRPLKRAGPLWCGPLADRRFLQSMMEQDLSSLNTKKRIEKMLNLLIEESGMPPTYYSVDSLSSKLKRGPPPVSLIVQRLKEIGYAASPTHFNPKAFKTNAPLEIIMKTVNEA